MAQSMNFIVSTPKPESLIINAPKHATLKVTGTPTRVGTTDYEKLVNKPYINDVEVVGHLSLDDLGIMGEDDIQIGLASNQDIEDMFNDFFWGE